MYLLAKFREPRTYVSLVKIVFKPGETAFDRMGDVVRFGTRWRIYSEEVLEEIQKADDDALIDRRSIHPDDVLEEMALGKPRVLGRLERRHALIGDVKKTWIGCPPGNT